MNINKRKSYISICLKHIMPVFLYIFIFFAAQQLLTPKYMSGIYEGALIAEYYDETLPHDVIFIGDCEVYTNISPVTLWENYGIASYVRGAPNQLMWQSYYILEDTLQYEIPAVVVFNVSAMPFGTPASEAYNRLNIDGMRTSRAKLSSARASMLEGESLFSYLFPLFRYHDRWREISIDDFRYLFTKDKVSINGYMIRCDIKPVDVVPAGRRLPDYSFDEISYKYLDMITRLCKENSIELILIKAPVIYPHWYAQWDEQITDYAKKNGLLYINCLDLIDEIGIDFAVDTYSAGLNLNVYGAEKLSDYLGGILANYANDKRSDSNYSAVWEKKVENYYRLKEQQEREFEEQGKIKTVKMKNK